MYAYYARKDFSLQILPQINAKHVFQMPNVLEDLIFQWTQGIGEAVKILLKYTSAYKKILACNYSYVTL